MELKKIIAMLIIVLFPLSLFAEDWFEIAHEILKKNSEPQVKYWVNFIETNLIENPELENHGVRIHKGEDFTIRELTYNDYGETAKSGNPSHTYEIEADGNSFVGIQIAKGAGSVKDEVVLYVGKEGRPFYWVRVTKNDTKYKYMNAYGNFGFTM